MPKTEWVDFEQVKKSVTIVQILERYGLMTKLHRRGDSLSGPCPIHNGENATAFRVSISKNCWNCFSQCKCGGNVLDFVSKKENVSIRKAALMIAEWFEVESFKPEIKREAAPECPVPEPKVESEAPKPQPAEEPLATENKPLAFSLQHLDAAHPYLKERGLSEETIAMFGLGFCKKGVMTNHIAIPIQNASGQLVAYAGRWPGNPPSSDTPKYKLPKGFNKSLEVFNLHRAKEIEAGKPLIVVEGFFDCMKFWQAGKKRTVSVMGSSVSEAQATAIIEAAGKDPRIILLFDEDKAGHEGRDQALIRFASKAYVKVIELGKDGLQPDQLTPEEISGLKLEEQPPPYGACIAKFRAGKLVATPNALESLTQRDIAVAIGRHLRGDWGDLDDHDRNANEQALKEHTRLLSVYHSANGVKFYVITEADRSVTTILLPEDY